MPHLSELHGAATHLAVVAIPLYAILFLARRAGVGGLVVAAAEPWVVGGAVVGIIAAGITGLLVRGQSQTMLRGHDNRIGTAHFWLGIALALLVIGPAAWRWLAARGSTPRAAPGGLVAVIGVVALVGVLAQGYLGGRMTYEHAVGINAGGELAQSAAGAKKIDLGLASGQRMADAGAEAFSASGLGCATCHGDHAQGLRGPPLAGGVSLEDFRRVHGKGLFPPSIVSDRDFRAVNAWLRTLPRVRGGGEG